MAVAVVVAVVVAVAVTVTDALQDITFRVYFAFGAILRCGQVAGVAGNRSLGSCSVVPGAAVHLAVHALTQYADTFNCHRKVPLSSITLKCHYGGVDGEHGDQCALRRTGGISAPTVCLSCHTPYSNQKGSG